LAKDNFSLLAFNEITKSKTAPFITAVKVADRTVEIGQTQSDYRHLTGHRCKGRHLQFFKQKRIGDRSRYFAVLPLNTNNNNLRRKLEI
jgi:hypothetical protein